MIKEQITTASIVILNVLYAISLYGLTADIK